MKPVSEFYRKWKDREERQPHCKICAVEIIMGYRKTRIGEAEKIVELCTCNINAKKYVEKWIAPRESQD